MKVAVVLERLLDALEELEGDEAYKERRRSSTKE